MRVRFLGTGTSHGVPVLGCACPVCTSADPRDRRYRTSLLIRGDRNDSRLTIDCGSSASVGQLP
jgi:phosphoribosyl 1,2-cyclic phosphate phosphodiesterase